MLHEGTQLRLTTSGRSVAVGALLGEGMQGSVYHAECAGEECALKWYHEHMATESQRLRIERLVSIGPPDHRFLWPLELAAIPDTGGFGYVMPLRGGEYRGLVDRVSGRVDLSFRVLATVAFGLADAFLQLHARGLCYRDVSFGNVFFHPVTGMVLVADNDNVAFDGTPDISVLGTPYFMAPEIVRGEALPSAATDRYSLAVLLFYLLFISHPLDGRRVSGIWDATEMRRAFGLEPRFIFDPDDPSNAPEEGIHDNTLILWPMYPKFLRDLFTQSFTVGLDDPVNGRVTESTWRQAMVRLRDSIAYCGACGKETIVQPGEDSVTCWSCGATTEVPPRLLIGNRSIVLNHDTRVFRHHLALDYDFVTVVAEVSQHPEDPSRWGLRNRSDVPWKVDLGGTQHEVPPGRSVSLVAGTEITFAPGPVEPGRIVA